MATKAPLQTIEGLTVGRNIHVNDAVGKCQAAVVAKVVDDEKGLVNAGGWRGAGTAATWSVIPYDEGGERNYGWHWIERV